MPIAQFGWRCGAWCWPWGILVCFVFFALMIAGLIYFVPRMMDMMGMCGRGDQRIDEDPLSILKKRYARGEITEQEFDQMRSKLDS